MNFSVLITYLYQVASGMPSTTVDSLLTDTSIRCTPLQNGNLELVPAFLYSPYLALYKMDTSLRQTLGASEKVSVLERVDCI